VIGSLHGEHRRHSARAQLADNVIVAQFVLAVVKQRRHSAAAGHLGYLAAQVAHCHAGEAERNFQELSVRERHGHGARFGRGGVLLHFALGTRLLVQHARVGRRRRLAAGQHRGSD
jgi:hypothetical protein